jgi:membrane protein implicated in regulation of membrane protease activity
MLHSKGPHNATPFTYQLKLLVFVHLIVIGWLYVALMMAVAEATNTTGTVLGAIFTFLLYGLAPVALVVYLMGTPARRRAIRQRELEAQEAARRAAAEEASRPGGTADSNLPDQRGEAPADAVAPVRKEP